MKSRPRPWRSLLPLVLGLASCALNPAEPPSPLQIKGMRATIIVVAPFNIALPLPVELKSSTQVVSSALIEYLEGHGKDLHLVEIGVGKTLWIESIKEVNDSGRPRNFTSAVGVFARKVQQRVGFDAIIVPSLYIQNAAIRLPVARWDGATQPIKFIGRSRQSIEMPPLATISAASLLIYVLDPEGSIIHTKRTGLELIQHMEIRIEKERGYDKRIWTLKADDPAIEDAVRMRAAIAHALYPYLPK